MGAANRAAAQRGLRGPTNLTIPKGGPSPLPKVAGSLIQVTNDHKSNKGGSPTRSSEGPRKGS